LLPLPRDWTGVLLLVIIALTASILAGSLVSPLGHISWGPLETASVALVGAYLGSEFVLTPAPRLAGVDIVGASLGTVIVTVFYLLFRRMIRLQHQ
jgi:uncharacterized membrane protein YeaQ/YmgE (transglycosylase-associated protein family)